MLINFDWVHACIPHPHRVPTSSRYTLYFVVPRQRPFLLEFILWLTTWILPAAGSYLNNIDHIWYYHHWTVGVTAIFVLSKPDMTKFMLIPEKEEGIVFNDKPSTYYHKFGRPRQTKFGLSLATKLCLAPWFPIPSLSGCNAGATSSKPNGPGKSGHAEGQWRGGMCNRLGLTILKKKYYHNMF